jgi:hypothetical protein
VPPAQVVWANLVRLLRQALQGGVLEAEEVLGACLVIAGSLAEQASELLPADRSSSGAGQHTTATDEGGAAAIASRLLGFAAELVGWARQQALLLEPQQPEAHEQRAGGALPPEEPAASAVLQHVCDIEQQVCRCYTGAWPVSKPTRWQARGPRPRLPSPHSRRS